MVWGWELVDWQQEGARGLAQGHLAPDSLSLALSCSFSQGCAPPS